MKGKKIRKSKIGSYNTTKNPRLNVDKIVNSFDQVKVFDNTGTVRKHSECSENGKIKFEDCKPIIFTPPIDGIVCQSDVKGSIMSTTGKYFQKRLKWMLSADRYLVYEPPTAEPIIGKDDDSEAEDVLVSSYTETGHFYIVYEPSKVITVKNRYYYRGKFESDEDTLFTNLKNE